MFRHLAQVQAQLRAGVFSRARRYLHASGCLAQNPRSSSFSSYSSSSSSSPNPNPNSNPKNDHSSKKNDNQPGPQRKLKPPDKFNYNPDTWSSTPTPSQLSYPLVTSNSLSSHTSPPTKVRMLVRDFIEDSLYNPNYGYFPKQVTIFTAEDRIEFNRLKNSVEFEEEVGRMYERYGVDMEGGPGRQIWHTPTELFKPYYGRAIARCLVSEYLLKYFPYEDLVIYEIGAGNGTLAQDILDYIREEYPDVYDRTRYVIIEISANLAGVQRERVGRRHEGVVEVVNKSVFGWETLESAPCYFLAMEVVDNFAHDVIRYDLKTLEPYQALVTIDAHGDFSSYYTRVTDPLISSFLTLRHQLSHPPPISRFLKSSKVLRALYTNLPFAPNLSAPEFIPTRLLSLLETLRKYFPRHRLLLSDFASLPDTIPGVNAPVVQTRFRNTTVPCSTLFVKQGYFDIFFPTDFSRLRDMYEHIISSYPPIIPEGAEDLPTRWSPLASTSTTSTTSTLGADFFYSYHPKNRRPPREGVASSSGLPVGERKSSVFTHAEFMETYADLGKTRLRNGENPLLDYYQNVKFLF